MEKNRIKIPSKIYAKAFNEGWLNSIGFYVFLCKNHSGKNYYFKPNQKIKLLKAISVKYNIGLTTVIKHINKLKENGLLSVYKTEIRLTSNKELFRSNNKFVFVPANINSLKDINVFLKTIPVLSNLVQQEKAIKRIQRYNYIKEQSNKRFGKLKVSELKQLNRYEKKGGKMNFNSKLQLSIKSMGNLILRRDKNTITKYKRFLKENKVINVFNEKIKVLNHKVSFCMFTDLRRFRAIDLNTYFYKGFIYHCMPSIIQVAYRGVNAL